MTTTPDPERFNAGADEWSRQRLDALAIEIGMVTVGQALDEIVADWREDAA